MPKLKKDRTFEYSCAKMEMLNAYLGSFKIKQWAMGKKRQSLLCQSINIKIWIHEKNSSYHSIMMSIGECSSSTIF